MLSKEEKQEICDKYFNSTKPKHLRSFYETTPKGNTITGYINQKPNHLLGSMIILTVNDEPVEQFIQSMPKIHYYKDERDIEHGQGNEVKCYEKLDGSCLILYPLKNPDGEIIEIVAKTRGRPIADSHFNDLYHKIDQKPITDYYKEHDGILIFELHGILNQHEIIHYNTGIDIRLIAIYENAEFNNAPGIAKKYNFQLPDKIFELYDIGNSWYLKYTSEKYAAYKPDEFKHEDKYYPTVTDAVLGIKHELEELNRRYVEVNGRLATEGVVINTCTKNGHLKWLKCKPRDIENKHRTVNGIPRTSITKEVLKYFDEYGSEVKEIYEKNPDHHTEYLHRQLSETYPPELIQKSKKKIERIFMQIWESKSVPEGISTICHDLFDKYSAEGISHCMRMFAQEYPMKKKDSRLVYGVLEKLFIKNGVEK